MKPSIDEQLRRGWTQKNAEIFLLLGSASNAISRSIRDRDSRYAASAYAVCGALYAASRADVQKKVPPMMYRHRRGPFSVSEDEPAWDSLDKPDELGFRGVTSSSLVMVDNIPLCFSEQGYSARVAETHRLLYKLMDSDIIGFESGPDDEQGAHSVIITTSPKNGCFPPNTQFRYKEEFAPGTWEAPGGVYPMQRLIVVTATYHPPTVDAAGKVSQLVAEGLPRFCTSVVSLTFGKPEAFFLGLDNLTHKPILSMSDEFARDYEWGAWDGSSFSLRAEWAYVTGEATPSTLGCWGERDPLSAGKLPEDFQSDINTFIFERRRSGLGSMSGDRAPLTRDEVLALRLFTGPAYIPINAFLRRISKLVGEYRDVLAQHPQYTFAATVGHICRAIRKLVDVASPEESKQSLWATMRGKVPSSLWDPDESVFPGVSRAGIIVDTGFFCASQSKDEVIKSMQHGDGGSNVLWEIRQSPENEEGQHCGANVRILAQFPTNQDVIFAPGTMLQVVDLGASKKACNELQDDSEGRSYCCIAIQPTAV